MPAPGVPLDRIDPLTVKKLMRSFGILRGHERIWLPLLVLSALSPPVVLAMPLVQKSLIDDVILQQNLAQLPWTAGLYAALWLLNTTIMITAGLMRTYLA